MVRAIALNWAAFNSSCVHALDLATSQTSSLWWREPGGSPIYLAALLLDPDVSDEKVFDELSSVHEAWHGSAIQLYDFWAGRDLKPFGYSRLFQNPWYVRPAAPVEACELPAGLSIEKVTTADQLEEFERACHIGFDNDEDDMPERLSQHGETTLDDPDMVYLVARLSGRVVASAIAYAAEGVLSIYAISVLEPLRRRGYGTALVNRAVALRPELPASVFPDPPSVPMYTCWGFTRGREIASWLRP